MSAAPISTVFNLSLVLALTACSDEARNAPDSGGTVADASIVDSSVEDSGPRDLGPADLGPTDLGPDAGTCRQASLPTESPTNIYAAAGAPVSLFGDESAPTFEAAFSELQQAGFNAFFPWFGTSEIDGVATVTGHFDYFLPGGARSCSAVNPYSAARGRLGILFPAFFFSNATGDAALDPAVFRAQYAAYRDQCWGGDDDVIRAFQSFDEIVSQRIVNEFFGNPGPRLQNVIDAADLIHELSDKPVLLVEGPLPTVVENEAGLTAAEKADLTERFWRGVDVVVGGTDIFGFDVYPVPSLPLTLPVDYQREADTRAPDTERLAVLQGFSYDAETNGMDPRRGPTLTEQRFMAFDALAAGADHIVWYGASALDLNVAAQQQIWSDLQTTVSLVSRIAPAIERTAIYVAAPVGLDATARTIDDGFLLIVINRTASATTATLELPFAAAGLVDFETGRDVPLASSTQFEINLEAWGVKIYLASTCSN